MVTVEVTAGDQHRSRRETIHPGRWTQMAFTLDASPPPLPAPPPADYALIVPPEPADARGRIMNIAPTYRDGIRLAPGRYRVRVDKPGFQTVDQWIELAAEDRTL